MKYSTAIIQDEADKTTNFISKFEYRMTKKSFYFNTWIGAFAITILSFINLISSTKANLTSLYKLELATSDTTFRGIMRQYELTDVVMENVIYNDYLYILSYTLLFYLSIKVIIYSEKIKKRSFLGIFTILPGCIDTLQNLLALEIINHSGLRSKFYVYEYLIWIKWLIIIPFIILVIIALRIQLLRLFTKTAATTDKTD